MKKNKKDHFKFWCVFLLIFFFVSNVLGVVRPMGIKPFHSIGFPFTFAAWGVGFDFFWDWNLLAINISIAILVSVLLAMLLSWLR